MKPGKLHTFSIGAALLALLAIVAVPGRPGGGSAALPSVAGNGVASRQPAITLSGPFLGAQSERAETLSWSRDLFLPAKVLEPVPVPAPMQPTSDPAPSAPLVRLTGISLMNGTPLAIVDREIVREGDQLRSGYVVTRITDRTITLRLGELEITLALGNDP